MSYPAHTTHPTRMVARADVEAVASIAPADANRRHKIRKYIHPGGIQSCQLVMGCTDLKRAVFGTPCRRTRMRGARRSTCIRRGGGSDGLPSDGNGGGDAAHRRSQRRGGTVAAVVHAQRRGNPNYSFIWAMGGENQEFADMDGIAVRDMK